jgi:hypothetical protein
VTNSSQLCVLDDVVAEGRAHASVSEDNQRGRLFRGRVSRDDELH